MSFFVHTFDFQLKMQLRSVLAFMSIYADEPLLFF